jgi:homoserine kinase type II
VAAFTHPTNKKLAHFLSWYGLNKYEAFQPVEGGSVNSNFSLLSGGKRWFLRLYEEQELEGARRELAMVGALAQAGVPTPPALGDARELEGRPAALFPWIEGSMRCQASVAARDLYTLGAAVASMHRASERLDAPEHRFGTDALRERLGRIAKHPRADQFPIERLSRELDTLERTRDESLPQGVVHGDLFRDNVLWQGTDLAALLDFESAFEGPLVYDLAVCTLSWCFGQDFSFELITALASGYESVRPLTDREREAFDTELRFAAVRFTITRITDYELRPSEGRVMKDWKRFLARLDAT